MTQAATTEKLTDSTRIITVGIDVGGKRKGFHAVALVDGNYASQMVAKDAGEIADWCHNIVCARVVAVDAPCRWSKHGNSRPAERALMQMGISCFSTPRRVQAIGHPTGYFDWMLSGENLYHALAKYYPLCRKLPVLGQRCCFETFPHAITWQLRGGHADARQKRTQRRALLKQAEIDLTELTNIDLIDAALCSLTAFHAATGGQCVSLGELDTGLIIVPGQREESTPIL